MSSWPVVGIWCTHCNRRRSVFDFDLDVCYTNEEQIRFADLLTEEGWDTRYLPDNEADDEGWWMERCPEHRTEGAECSASTNS